MVLGDGDGVHCVISLFLSTFHYFNAKLRGLVVRMKGLEMNLANTPSTSGVHCTGIILRNLFLFVTSNGVCLLSRLPVIIYYESENTN